MPDEDFLFGKAVREEDVPLEKNNIDQDIESQRLERDKERKEKRYTSAFRLIVGCLIFLGAIYLVDTIVVIAFDQVSETTNSIIEVVKTLLFTLSGYLFARKENGD